MEDQVEEIKRKADIVGVVGGYVALKKGGKHHKGLCPFHSEKTPSFVVNEELGLYKCFGCGAGGDVFKFLMEIEGIEFREALERLAEKVGVRLERRNAQEKDEREAMLEIMELAAKYFNWVLTTSKAGEEARKYCEERKLTNELISTFRIGYALPSWDGLVSYLVGKKGFRGEMLEKVGLVNRRDNGGFYDRYRGRLMFPLTDSAGKVVGFTGRILPAIAKETEPKYVNSPETPLYHKSVNLYGFSLAKKGIREKKRVVLVEGQMDCVSSFGAGVGETVAVGGTSLTEEQVEMLARLTSNFILAMDDDSAGNAAMKRSVEIAEKRGVSIKVVRLEGGKDPDEIARKSAGVWREMVETSVDVYEYVMEKAFQKFDKKSMEGVKKISEEVMPFLEKINNVIVRELWVKKLAERLGVSEGVVFSELMKETNRGAGRLAVTESGGVRSIGKKEKMAKKLVRYMAVMPKIRGDVSSWIGGWSLSGALGKIIEWLCEQKEENVGKLKEMMPMELTEAFAEAYMEDEGEKFEEKDVREATVGLLREVIKENKMALTGEMRKARQEQDEDKEEKILVELNELNKKESRLLAVLG